ncbi:MAG: ABC transporter ATP-binding protein [Candidatus Nanoarchaeia archaeon]
MILNIKNISKHFGGLKAVDNCTFDIKRGKITAIIGPNGSGKSTLFNVISQLMKQTKGKMTFDGERVSLLKDFQVSRMGISRTFQEVRLFRNLTIYDHLDVALSQTDEQMLTSTLKARPDHKKTIKEVLDLVGLDKPLSTYAIDLSYGQRKLLDLAVAIAKPHTLLMLDEPVAGVNPKLRGEIKKILRKLNAEGETVLLIEHDMNFVMDLADWIIVLDEGSVLLEGKPKAVQNNKKVLDAYLGE